MLLVPVGGAKRTPRASTERDRRELRFSWEFGPKTVEVIRLAS